MVKDDHQARQAAPDIERLIPGIDRSRRCRHAHAPRGRRTVRSGRLSSKSKIDLSRRYRRGGRQTREDSTRPFQVMPTGLQIAT
jgi:hypothetical protein